MPKTMRILLFLWLLAVATVSTAETADTTVIQYTQTADAFPYKETTATSDLLNNEAANQDSLVAVGENAISAMDILTQDDKTTLSLSTDSVARKAKKNWDTWSPNPKRALWLALVLPGAGQIYNRKYWKIPIVYGGFVGCIYAMRWNNQMFRDYSQAYMDIMDDDPNTQSYNQFLHLGANIDETNIERYKNLFKKRKDKYRRWRDMSFFCLVGVYALSVIDAYVDASLSEFDISRNLSLKVEPTIINSKETCTSPLKQNSLGVSCSLNF